MTDYLCLRQPGGLFKLALSSWFLALSLRYLLVILIDSCGEFTYPLACGEQFRERHAAG